MDAQDWEAWREVFTDDVRVDLGDGDPIEGAGAFVAAVRGMVTGAVTVHHGHMPDLTIDSATEAHGTWALAELPRVALRRHEGLRARARDLSQGRRRLEDREAWTSAISASTR